MKIDREKFDEIVLALLFHNSWRKEFGEISVFRAWKSLDWDALERLHKKDLISSPQGKAKSVVLTDEGYVLAQQMYEKHFAENENSEPRI
jgi:predicted transcriptional regulator